jgi:four helix bundle protein
MNEEKFDLEERLLEFSVSIIQLVDKLPDSRAGRHISGQLLRSGTSPLPNHGEAQAAESRDDFIHKLKLCLKELRESWRWMRLAKKARLVPEPTIDPVLKESDELIRIFVTSIKTASARPRD